MALTTAIAIGSLAVGAISDRNARKAASRATGAQLSAQDRSLAEQQRQFDLTREDFAGTRERGELAGEQLASFLGLRGQEEEQRAIAGFTESPGQAFLRERAERTLLRNEAATGGLGGGNVLTALQEQAIGISAGQLGERKSRLAGVAGLGVQGTAVGAQIGADISGRISGGLERVGDITAEGIRRQSEIRQSGLRRIAGAFTGSGGFGFGTGSSVAQSSGRLARAF